jgi:hypothetical protein
VSAATVRISQALRPPAGRTRPVASLPLQLLLRQPLSYTNSHPDTYTYFHAQADTDAEVSAPAEGSSYPPSRP